MDRAARPPRPASAKPGKRPSAGTRLRLTLQFTVVSMALLGAFSLSTYYFFRAKGLGDARERLRQDMSLVKEYIKLQPPASGEKGRLPGDVMFLVEENERIVYHSEAMAKAFLKGLDLEPSDYEDGGVWRSDAGHEYSLISDTLALASRSFVIAVAIDLGPLNRQLSALALVLLMAFCVGAILSALLGHWFTGRALAPLGKMAEKALKISLSSLSERLPVERPGDELGRLATVFNDMLDRLDKSFAGLTSFTADVSDELRSPLAAIREAGEGALREGNGPEELRAAVSGMLAETDRLSALVDDMLFLARADGVDPAVHAAPVRVGALLHTAVGILSVRAEERDLSLITDLGGQGLARVDEDSMLRAFLDVIGDAIRRSPRGGEIRLRTKTGDDGRVEIELDDGAPPMEREEREAMFDPRRGREGGARDGGAVPVLAIARRTVESHGGRIRFTELPGGGGNRCVIELPGAN